MSLNPGVSPAGYGGTVQAVLARSRSVGIGWELWASLPNESHWYTWAYFLHGKGHGLPSRDDLLAEVDAEARRGGMTRSAVMREFADAALHQRRESRAMAMRSLLSDASPYGGRAAELVKATRPGP
jgi:hypothetical protein